MKLAPCHRFLLAFISLTVPLFGGSLFAQVVPGRLPDPDGKPGNPGKPVQVYILAGQSNMVGMGNLSGAKNMYTGVYFSSDPKVPDGPFSIYRVGNFKVSPLRVFRPDGSPTTDPIGSGKFVAPLTGKYIVHCGHGESSVCTMQMNGQKVYSRENGNEPVSEEISLRGGARYEFQIIGFNKQAPRFWLEKIDLVGYGDLESVVKRDGKFPWIVDANKNWSVQQDVYFQEARLSKDGKGSFLSATSNGKSIGPELGFGYVMGTFHDQQVLLIKTAQGNRSLGFDFRPPSSGRTDPENNFESAEYRLMIEGVRKTLNRLDEIIPGYQGQGYQIAGFVWFQGHKDSFSESGMTEYEQNLVNLISDVRKEFKAPKLPVVIATVGFGGHRMAEKFRRIWQAQMAVGDPRKHPEFANTVATVDTRDFWREVDQSPANQDYHYHRNAETYLLIGDAIGRAMVRLQGGKAEPLPAAYHSNPSTIDATSSSEKPTDPLATQAALRPIILDGIIPSYVSNPRYRPALIEEASGRRPAKPNQFLRGAMYGLLNCYSAAGITEYDWHSFGPDLDSTKWDYLSFDPPEKLPLDKGNRYREVTFPKGAETWTSTEFRADQAGFRAGFQPFGQLGGKLLPLSESCNAPFCRCGEKPKTLWKKEVLLVRANLEFPPMKQGHRYRLVVGGAAHVNSGEGFALFVNGRKIAESKSGVAVRQGGQPRGTLVYNDVREALSGKRATIAAISFLRYNHPRRGVEPPRGHFSLQIQEQKLPPVVEQLR